MNQLTDKQRDFFYGRKHFQRSSEIRLIAYLVCLIVLSLLIGLAVWFGFFVAIKADLTYG